MCAGRNRSSEELVILKTGNQHQFPKKLNSFLKQQQNSREQQLNTGRVFPSGPEGLGNLPSPTWRGTPGGMALAGHGGETDSKGRHADNTGHEGPYEGKPTLSWMTATEGTATADVNSE